ncbi:MAG: hypothetical protein ACRC6E_03740 [Fusobacteriaceae bacterium]
MFKVNDRVIDIKRGKGTVSSILNGREYQVRVYFDYGYFYSYTMEGKAFAYHDYISLIKEG